MNNEEKALKIAVGTVSERTRNHPSNLPHIIIVKDACIEMAQWKDEQLANCIERLEKEYIKNSGKGLLSNEEIAAKLATLKRIEEEMKIRKI